MSTRSTTIVIDPNVWVYDTQLLSSPLGASLLYVIKSNAYVLAIPEVLNLEITKHTVKVGLDACNKINEKFRCIEMIMRNRDDYYVPTADDFKRRVAARFSELGIPIKDIPFRLEHARAALIRVFEESAPNGEKNQQFKDSAVWEVLIELAREEHVAFITKDLGFFEDKKTDKGLASNLKSEAAACIA